MIIKRGVVYGPWRPRSEGIPKYLLRFIVLMARVCWFLIKMPLARGGIDNKKIIKE